MGRYVFKLPDVGEGTAEAEIVEWKVKVGDTVAEDQPLADVMTDKATVELTSPVAGKVVSLHGKPGDMAAVKAPLVELEVEGAGNAAAAEAEAPTPAEAPEPQPETVVEREADAEAITPDPDMAVLGNYVFKLPDVGEGTAEAELVEWKVKVGATVAEDQPLADVMTDKATVELTSPTSGRVVALNGEVGKMVAVGSALVVLEVEGAGNMARGAAPKAAPVQPASKPEAKAQPAPKPAASAPAPSPARAAPAKAAAPAFATRTPGERPLASPAVRKRARELGIELPFVPGSGPAGRIQHEDLDAFLSSGGSGARPGGGTDSRYAVREGTTEVRIIGLRRKIAEKMAESVRRIPHITYVEEVDVGALEDLRAHLNATRAPGRPKLTLLPFLARAMVRALPDQPQINATYDDEAGVLTQHAAVHLGIAAQTPNGLMVPVVRNAEALDVWATAEEIARVSKAAKDGTAKREELSGSTITITSLGTLGGVVHTPIINHPEVAIVGPNKIVERPVVKDGQVVVRKMMNVSSSFDHRIVDGHDAATFVGRLKAMLENPATLWME